MPCDNFIDCCKPDMFAYDSNIPDPAPEPPVVETCPTCTDDVVGNCVLPPDDIPDLGTWLRAYEGTFQDVAGTIPSVDGGLVKKWDDDSVLNLDLTDGGFLPGTTYHTNVKNGLPVVRTYATGTPPNVDTASLLGNASTTITQPETLIMALRFRSDPLWPDNMGRNAITFPLAFNNVMYVGRNGDGSIFMGQKNYVTGATLVGFSGGSVAINEFVIITAVFNAANSALIINNGEPIAGNSGSGNYQFILVGGRGTAPLDESLRVISCCDYCEIAKFSRLLTSSEIFGVTNYLSQTWAIPISS